MLGRTTFGRDEMASWEFAHLSIPDLVRAVGHLDAVLAPYYLFLHLWTIPGDGAFWMRLPSAIAVAAAAGIAARVAQRAWGVGAGLLTGFAVALHPTVAAIGVEARPYALALALCTYATALVLDENGLRRRPYVVAMSLAVLLHLFAVVVLAAHLLVQRSRRAVVAAAVVAAVGVPIALMASSQRVQVSYIPDPTVSSTLRILREVALPGPLLWFGLVAVVMLAIAAWNGDESGPERRMLVAGLALAVVPALLLFLASQVTSPVLTGRYLFTAPLGVALVLGSAAGLARASGWLSVAVPVVVLVAVVGPDLRTLHAPRYNGADYPQLARILAAQTKPGDEIRVVIRASQGGMPAGVALYTDDQAFLDDVLDGLPDGEPLVYRRTVTGPGQTVPAVAPSRTVWLVGVNGTKPALDAVAALRAEGCRIRATHDLGELVLYLAGCARARA